MAEQITLAYRLFTMRRWMGTKWTTAARWACGLVWQSHQEKRRERIERRSQVEQAARQRL